MSVSIFRHGRRLGTSITLPESCRKRVGWQPQVNDRFPDITAVTTRGALSLHDWARGSWVYLMAHPAAFTPVCSTELSELARRIAQFDERNVRVIALTRDTVEQITAWTRQIESVYCTRIDFPHIADPHGVISRACGMVSQEAEWNGPLYARRTFVIDPKGIIRAIFDYPLAVGRSVDEALRTIDALQITGSVGGSAPGEWKLGDPLLANGDASEGMDSRFVGRKTKTLTPYLKFVDLSRPDTSSKGFRPIMATPRKPVGRSLTGAAASKWGHTPVQPEDPCPAMRHSDRQAGIETRAGEPH